MRRGYIIVKGLRILVEIVREADPIFGRVDYFVRPVAGEGEQRVTKESFFEIN